ncbi:MAG: hypothetical protein ACI4JB_09915 [Porcipelethomonas sp.]
MAKPKGKKKKPTKCKKISNDNLLINALIDLIIGTLLILIDKLIND